MLAVVLTASCGFGASPSSTSTSDPQLVATARSIADPPGDLADEAGKKVVGNTPVDLTQVEASADGTDLRVTLTMAGDVPPKIASTSQKLNYIVVIEADRSGDFDYSLIVTNLETGVWSVGYTEWPTGVAHTDANFPGTFQVLKNQVTFTISLSAIGSPASLRMSAITKLADKDGNIVAQDQAPTGDPYKPAEGWLSLGP